MRKLAACILVLGFVLLALPAAAQSLMLVTFLDTEKGEAALVQVDGQAMLVDAGAAQGRGALMQALVDLRVSPLDYVVVTHPEAGRIGALDRVALFYDMTGLYVPDSSFARTSSCVQRAKLLAQRRGAVVMAPADGFTWTLGSAAVTVWSVPDARGEPGLVLRVDHGQSSILFLGGANLESIRELQMSPANVVRGSGAQTAALAFPPQYAVITDGGKSDLETTKSVTFLALNERGNLSFMSDEISIWLQGIHK